MGSEFELTLGNRDEVEREAANDGEAGNMEPGDAGLTLAIVGPGFGPFTGVPMRSLPGLFGRELGGGERLRVLGLNGLDVAEDRGESVRGTRAGERVVGAGAELRGGSLMIPLLCGDAVRAGPCDAIEGDD